MEFGKVFRQTNVSEKELELKSNEELLDNATELIIIFYCTKRALCKLLDCSWEVAYLMLVNKGYNLKMMPTTIKVFDEVMKDLKFLYNKLTVKGEGMFKRQTVANFAKTFNRGTYILETKGHVLFVRDGNYYDKYNCGNWR